MKHECDLPLEDLAYAVETLVCDVLGVTEEELGRVVVEHAEHGRVELHPITFDAEGNEMQMQFPTPPLSDPLRLGC